MALGSGTRFGSYEVVEQIVDGLLPSEGPPDSREINIRSFPDVARQRRPVAAGMHPVFSKDGSEIFYFDLQGGLSVVTVDYEPFRIGNPTALFRGVYWWGVAGAGGQLGRAWDIDPNNDRFLMITMPGAAGSNPFEPDQQAQINVVLNWVDELEARVPTD